ncbi:MAG: hypothetical protein SGJ27_26795 [Candidatus Melainabacteria bacterium]|nr:hypothetical protein [Candidatus Melainabacteria bacterium]
MTNNAHGKSEAEYQQALKDLEAITAIIARKESSMQSEAKPQSGNQNDKTGGGGKTLVDVRSMTPGSPEYLEAKRQFLKGEPYTTPQVAVDVRGMNQLSPEYQKIKAEFVRTGTVK